MTQTDSDEEWGDSDPETALPPQLIFEARDGTTLLTHYGKAASTEYSVGRRNCDIILEACTWPMEGRT